MNAHDSETADAARRPVTGGAMKIGAGDLSIVRGEPLDDNGGPEAQTIAAYAREVTLQWADHEALVLHTPAGVERWTYRELWDRSMAIARALVAAGVGKGSRVGVLMANRPEYVASVFGIALAGGVTVALNTFATVNELEHQLQASGVDTLLFEPQIAKKDFAAILAKLEPAIAQADGGELRSERLPFLRRAVALGESWADFLRRGQAVPDRLVMARAATLTPSDTAMLFFSSGSTGSPKGILQTHRAVALQWRRWPTAMGLAGPLRVWTANGFFWSGNFVMAIGSAFSTGGAIVLQTVFDAAEALKLMHDERVNTPYAMPHQWGRIAELPYFRQVDLSELRFFDPQWGGFQHPTLPCVWRQPQAFGCTETLTINTTTFFDEAGKTRREGHGLPLPGNTLKIVDPLTGEIAPRGQRGEIAVKGPTLMTGYLGKTAEECFDDEGFYRTGDGGYLDPSGWLFWEGRLTDIIKTGGANVSPLEVDEAIKSHPGVKATQTVGLPHDTLGEIVVSCAVIYEDAKVDEGTLHEFLKERLASYKLPRHILFLSEDEMSMTGSGNKIKSADIRKLAAARLKKGPDGSPQ